MIKNRLFHYIDNQNMDLREITKGRILAVRMNKELTEQEKNLRIQQIMMGNHVPKMSDVQVSVAEEQKTWFSEGILGCKHYRRNCRLVAPCCGKSVTCRLCHDETMDHEIDRYAIQEVVCMQCFSRQPVAQNCVKCGECFATYFCGTCNFFDNDESKNIFHCDKCNVCRIGLPTEFFHCDICNSCLSITLKGDHKCVNDAMHGDCPICMENMRYSVNPVIPMQCGHAMHHSCYEDYIKTNYKCPTCQKSVGDMSRYFRNLDEYVAETQMPEEYCDVMREIYCNDCEKNSDVPFHIYMKCAHCGSYNTKN